MNKKAYLALLPLLAGFSTAGEEIAPEPLPEKEPWITPTLDIRTRYEFREVDGLDASHSLTARARLGFLTKEFSGFSAFAEAEGTTAIVGDYRSNPTGNDSTYPYVVGNTPIGDPRSFELNRAWLKYKNSGFSGTVGRQRLIRQNAAFIGNVGWRQNEQTFDAAEIAYKNDAFSASYVYSDRVVRIFGSEANEAPPGPPLRYFEGDFHFLDASYKLGEGSLDGYVYLIDVDNNANVGESNTIGVLYKDSAFHAELAFQDGESALVSGSGDYDALYGHFKYTHKVGKASYIAGVEYLEEDFKTPFGTVHAFNGFADAFILNRIGLSDSGGGYEGITDFYLGYTRGGLPGKMVFKGFFHYFLDDGVSDAYGYEFDAVLVKPINENLKALLKAAFFIADDDSAYGDIQQVTVELNYKY